MAYLSEQTIASDISSALTVPTVAGGQSTDAQSCTIEVRGGAFSYRMSGSDASAGTWYSLSIGQQLVLVDKQMEKFRIIRDTPGSGTVYVTYDDKVPDKNSRRWGD